MNVLVIDDNENVVAVYKQLLGVMGHTCEVFSDPIKGLRRYSKDRHHLVLSDYHMPGMNGIQVMHAVHAIYPQAKVVIMSGDAGREEVLAAGKNGAYDFLAKPVGIDRWNALLIKLQAETEEIKDSIGLDYVQQYFASNGN